jgi:hypothetical protein
MRLVEGLKSSVSSLLTLVSSVEVRPDSTDKLASASFLQVSSSSSHEFGVPGARHVDQGE